MSAETDQPAGPAASEARPRVRPRARRRKTLRNALARLALRLNLFALPVNLARRLGPERTARLASHIARRIGPFLPEHKLARANLAAAMPELSRKEQSAILRGMWDNLGRLVAETFHLDWVTERDETGKRRRITGSGREWTLGLKERGQSAIVFSAHLANWELVPTISAGAGISTTLLFRRPPHPAAAEVMKAIRGEETHTLVASGRGAAWSLAEAFQRGEMIGLMMDQRLGEGIVVPFFGRPAATNPIVARLARTFECPVHGIRVIRLPDSRFHIEVTPPIELPRDAKGRIDVVAGTAEINRIIEGWVREHPEQWLWAHNRWRMNPPGNRQ